MRALDSFCVDEIVMQHSRYFLSLVLYHNIWHTLEMRD